MSNPAVSAVTPASKPVRRRRYGVESRRVLVESALTLLAEGKAPTSVNITALAGLAQPTFYAHFKSVDACLLAAAQYVQGKSHARHDYERKEAPPSSVFSPKGLEKVMANWLEASLTTQPMYDALARFAHDETPLGDLVRQIHHDNYTQMAEQLFAAASCTGVSREHFDEFMLLAQLHFAACSAMSRLVHEGKVESVERGAKTLTRNISALLYVTAAACGGDASKLLRDTGWTVTGSSDLSTSAH